jgi:hypothetical protein
VFANDDAAPAQSVVVDASGNTTFKQGTIVLPSNGGTIAFKRYSHVVTVGELGDYATLKEAVDAFNAGAIDTTILLDAGVHKIAATVVVNNQSAGLAIRGYGTSTTFVEADTGLTGSPMFNIQSACDMSDIYFYGGALANYGTLAGENLITYDTVKDFYCELTSFFAVGFKVGVADLIGVQLFMFNFVFESCDIGFLQEYTSINVNTTADIEVGNFDNCRIGIKLSKATAGGMYFSQLIFINAGSTDVGLLYVPGAGNYELDPLGLHMIINCSYNRVGTMFTGFDWATERDSLIEMRGNVGDEDRNPHAKIGVESNDQSTIVTTANKYYKATFINTVQYAVKMQLSDNRMQHLGREPRDVVMHLSAGVSSDIAAEVDTCIMKHINVSSVVGDGATVTVTTSTPHGLETGFKVQMEDWSISSHNGIFTVTEIVESETQFTFQATGAGTSTGGACNNILGVMGQTCAGSWIRKAISSIVYGEDMNYQDYYEIWVRSDQPNTNIKLHDIHWYVEGR